MKKLKKTTELFGKFLQGCMILAIAILGVILVIALFKELVPIGKLVLSSTLNSQSNYILEQVIIFFLILEFTAMTIATLRHHGHTSINFLLGLGVTALTRNLLTAHESIELIIYNSIAVLLLIIALVIYNKFYNNEE